MIEMSVAQAKGFFFDRAPVAKAIDKAAKRVLSKIGAYVRQRAKTSMKKRKKSAPPGSPPSAHLGLIKKFLFFAYQPETKSVVIGPVRINRGSIGAMKALEQGGMSRGVRYGRPFVARYEPRPFMRPALLAELPKFAPEFKDQVR